MAEEEIVSVEVTEQNYTPRSSQLEYEHMQAPVDTVSERRSSETSEQVRAHSEALIGINDLDPNLKVLINTTDEGVR